MTLYPAGLFSSFCLCLDGTTRFSHRYVHRGCHQRPAGLLLWHQLSLFSPSTLSHFWNLNPLWKKKESSNTTNLSEIEDSPERWPDFKLKLTTRAKTRPSCIQWKHSLFLFDSQKWFYPPLQRCLKREFVEEVPPHPRDSSIANFTKNMYIQRF